MNNQIYLDLLDCGDMIWVAVNRQFTKFVTVRFIGVNGDRVLIDAEGVHKWVSPSQVYKLDPM